jgi:hypothetical protein
MATSSTWVNKASSDEILISWVNVTHASTVEIQNSYTFGNPYFMMG